MATFKNLNDSLSVSDKTLVKKLNNIGNTEGWGIYCAVSGDTDGNDEWRIERHDDMAVFMGDKEAMIYVAKNHKEAIDFFIRNGSRQELAAILSALNTAN